LHNGGLDYCRLLAAFGIVLFHSGATGATIGYAGLSYFLLTLSLFGLQSASARHFGQFVADRAHRLLLPWLIWSGLYGVLKVAQILLTDADVASEFQWWMLITGPALHLWFLPFAFVTSLLLPTFANIWNSATHLVRTAFNILLLLGTLLMLKVATDLNHAGPPFAQWAYATPAVLLGLFLGANWPIPHRRTMVTMACLLTLGTAMFFLQVEGSLQLTIASLAILFCLYVPLQAGWAARICATTSLTVYLVHPLVMSVLKRSLHMPAASLTLAVWTVIISFAVAIAPTALKRLRLTHGQALRRE
jgi:peptidoglycan/LPS O-acetylase OafA/YrhL